MLKNTESYVQYNTKSGNKLICETPFQHTSTFKEPATFVIL